MSDLRELYQEVIIDHNRHPRNRRKIENPSILRAKPGSGPLFQPADMKRLDLEIFFYPELRSFTPKSRLLYTAERRNLG